jgi:hypothetical protein
MTANETPDVLPAWANQTLILLWLLLFGGRWLFAPALQLAGLLSGPQLAALDENVLLKLYLVLLAITCVAAALRAVRTSQAGGQIIQPAGDGAGPLHVDGLPTASPISADASPESAPDAESHSKSVSKSQEATLNRDDSPPQSGESVSASTVGDENP